MKIIKTQCESEFGDSKPPLTDLFDLQIEKNENEKLMHYFKRRRDWETYSSF